MGEVTSEGSEEACYCRQPGLWVRLRLFWGRPRRLFNNVFRPGYVARKRRQRRGACRQCGMCCQMGNRCRFLQYETGLALCSVYNRRLSPNCHRFPIDERDIADRDLIQPEVPCGFKFEPEMDD